MKWGVNQGVIATHGRRRSSGSSIITSRTCGPNRQMDLWERQVHYVSVDDTKYITPLTKKMPSIVSYEMDANPHGIALIINNYGFKEGKKLDYLSGYLHDEENLQKTLQSIKYEVCVYRNCTKKQIDNIMNDTVATNHSKYDSFICCVLSHMEVKNYFMTTKENHITLTTSLKAWRK